MYMMSDTNTLLALDDAQSCKMLDIEGNFDFLSFHFCLAHMAHIKTLSYCCGSTHEYWARLEIKSHNCSDTL